MRVVVCHNFYQLAGGEDRVFADETQLLASRDHQVVTFTKHNDDVAGIPVWKLAAQTIWNKRTAGELERLVRDHQAEVVHFHNTLPLVSPAAYYAARRAGAAVVQTIHNYRLVCPKSTFFREGRPCESCLKKLVPWPAVRHACYRDNRAASAAVAAMLTFHRLYGTYQRAIDAYIMLSEFSRNKLAASGLPIEKMHLKPNFMLEDPGLGDGAGEYVLYVGRLSPEKGLTTLLEAWQHDECLPLLKIAGTGPLENEIRKAAEANPRIEWLGYREGSELFRLIGSAAALILPSLWYEGFPKTIVEAYSKGTPIIASKLGSLSEAVLEGQSGACFVPGDATDLAATVRRVISDPPRLRQMRRTARWLFETKYSASANHARLLEIYQHALRSRHGDSREIVDDGVVHSSSWHPSPGVTAMPASN